VIPGTKPLAARCRPVFLLALVVALVVAAPQATVSIVWRSSLVSFDDPATQVLDELTSQKTPYADPLGEARAEARTAAASSRRLAPGEPGCARSTQSRDGVDARAPPALPPSA
jgi:hypothetical protein